MIEEKNMILYLILHININFKKNLIKQILFNYIAILNQNFSFPKNKNKIIIHILKRTIFRYQKMITILI